MLQMTHQFRFLFTCGEKKKKLRPYGHYMCIVRIYIIFNATVIHKKQTNKKKHNLSSS